MSCWRPTSTSVCAGPSRASRWSRRRCYRVEDALQRLVRLLGGPEWQNLLAYLPRGLSDERLRRSAIAAHLGACLELARDGVIELNQAAPFGPIYIRRKR